MDKDQEIQASFDRRKIVILKELRSLVHGGKVPSEIITNACDLFHRFTRKALPEWKERIGNAGGYDLPLMIRYDGMLRYYEVETAKLKMVGENYGR